MRRPEQGPFFNHFISSLCSPNSCRCPTTIPHASAIQRRKAVRSAFPHLVPQNALQTTSLLPSHSKIKYPTSSGKRREDIAALPMRAMSANRSNQTPPFPARESLQTSRLTAHVCRPQSYLSYSTCRRHSSSIYCCLGTSALQVRTLQLGSRQSSAWIRVSFPWNYLTAQLSRNEQCWKFKIFPPSSTSF